MLIYTFVHSPGLSPYPQGTPYSQAASNVFQHFHESLLHKSARSEATLEIAGSLTVSLLIAIE